MKTIVVLNKLVAIKQDCERIYRPKKTQPISNLQIVR